MFTIKRYVWLTTLLLGTVAAVIVIAPAQAGKSLDAQVIDNDVNVALEKLYKSSHAAKGLRANAKGILVFPNIYKAAFGFGAQYGKGALRVNGTTTGYYNSLAASFGFQAGLQGFGYALFFMDDDSLSYLDNSDGWELGVGPSLVIVDAGFGKNFSSTTLKGQIYAFIFDQKGAFGGISIEGAKITKINP
jgi:lipid-binding SYLF domain-containing protein